MWDERQASNIKKCKGMKNKSTAVVWLAVVKCDWEESYLCCYKVKIEEKRKKS